MAISVRRDEKELEAKLSNGHLEALDGIVKAYGLTSEEEAISFMLAIFATADGSPIGIKGSEYLPSAKLKAKD